MGWQYIIETGELLHNGYLFYTCYAGNGVAKNNPLMQRVKGHGPLPCNLYLIGPAHDGHHLGPVCMDLTPRFAIAMFGRTDFRVHAERMPPAKPGEASEGCIVLADHNKRVEMANIVEDGGNFLTVVAHRNEAAWLGFPPQLG